MNSRQALIGTAHLFIVFFFLLAALFFMSVPQLDTIRMRAADLLLYQKEDCIKIAIALFSTALILFFCFFRFDKERSLKIEMGKHLTKIDRKILQNRLERFFQEKYQEQIFLKKVTVEKKNRLEVGLYLTPECKNGEFLSELERELSSFLSSQFGFKEGVSLLLID